MEMETKFKNLQEKYKILADKNIKRSTLRDNSLQPVNTNKTTDEPKEDDLTDDTNSIMESYNIPTANKFENLTKQDEPTNENQQIKTNKYQTANDEPTSGIQQSTKDQDNTGKDSKTATASTSNIQNTNVTLSTEMARRQTEHKQNNPNQMELETTLQMMQTQSSSATATADI